MNLPLFLTDADGVAAWILVWLGQALLYGTLLAALTALIARILRQRVSNAIHMALWSIVLFKFLVPVGPSWSHSLASICEGRSQTSAALPATDLIRPGAPSAGPAKAAAAGKQTLHADVRRQRFNWPVPVAAAYVAAVLGLSIARIRSYRAFHRRCRALPGADEATRRLVARVCRRLGVRRVPTTRISDEPPAPFVMGVFRPLLVLSPRQLVRPDELETVVVHEVAHFRRRDMFARQLQRIAGVLLFFWPVVAWVNRRIDMAREFTCDEWALRYGRLTAGEYAQCLLSATRLKRASRLAYRPVCMASSLSTIERRIDVILESPIRSSRRPAWGLPTLALLSIWGSFSLAGAEETGTTAGAGYKTWPATEQAVKEHAVELYNMAVRHEVADFNGDGVLSYREKSAYLVSLAMRMPDAFMEEFPYADRDHSGRLDLLEAYGTIRGITLVAYADRRPNAATEETLALAFCHMALDAQEWLLDNMAAEPDATDLENALAVIRRIEGPPHQYHKRMLDHGGPLPDRGRKGPRGELRRFKELEANIALVQSRLDTAKDAREMARLQVRLEKLETLLEKLNATVDQANAVVDKANETVDGWDEE